MSPFDAIPSTTESRSPDAGSGGEGAPQSAPLWIDLDAEGIVRAVDPAFADSIALPARFVVDRPFLVFVASADRVVFMRAFSRALVECHDDCSVSVGAPDAKPVPVLMSLTREHERVRCQLRPGSSGVATSTAAAEGLPRESGSPSGRPRFDESALPPATPTATAAPEIEPQTPEPPVRELESEPTQLDRSDPRASTRTSDAVNRVVPTVDASEPSPAVEPFIPVGDDLPRRGIEVTSHGIAILDASRPGIVIVWSNPAFQAMNGVAAGADRTGATTAPNARTFESLRPENVDFQSWGRLRLALSRGVSAREVVQCSRPDGAVFSAELAITPIPDSGQGPDRTGPTRDPADGSDRAKRTCRYFVCVQRDISDRASLENELRESEARYRVISELVTHLTYGYRVIEGRLEFAWLEGQVSSITGFHHDELIDRGTWAEIVHSEDRENVDRHHQRLLSGRESEVEYRIVRPDGKQRWLRDHARPVHDSTSRVVQIIGAARDFTREQRRVEEQQSRDEEGRQTQKMDAIARLAGGVAHDFNNLLTTILGNVSLLEERLHGSADAVSPLVDEVVQAARQASQLTQQLLAFGERQVMRPESLDLNGVVTHAVGLLERILPSDIQLYLDRVEGNLGVTADRSQIEQIVLNLGLNAHEALRSGGSIRIETQAIELEDEIIRGPVVVPAGRYARVSVIDDGIGFDETTRDRIFEPFFTTKEFGDGRGLGLATVYGIVRQSGGRITVDSAPGCGARFDVYFPLDSATHVVSTRVDSSGAVVLVVEDEPGVRRLLCQVLTEAGYQVLEAENGARALEVLQGNGGPVDLLVTDVIMPELGGRDLAQRVRSAYPDTRVLFISGYSYDAMARDGVLDDDVEFLQKPFVPETLTEVVRNALAS